jgi:4-amino-4-deoxy-L-arabinose transferase-like glycosyltransferase
LSIKIELDFKKLLPVLNNVWEILTKFNITHLLLISFALHIFCMTQPTDGMIFDEVHYIKATRAHLQGIGANAEHTPLVKVLMTIPFTIFGDYWFSWRFPIVISCMIAYIAFYYIAKHFLDEKYALLATAFLCFDIMFFIHGTIYLLDMPAIAFGLVAIVLYLYKNYKLSAVSMTLAILCKEIALFFLLLIFLHWLGTNYKKIPKNLKIMKTPLVYLSVVVLLGFSFIAVYDNVYKISSGTVVAEYIHNTVVTDEIGNTLTTVISTSTETFTKTINNPIDHMKLFLTYHGEYMKDLNSTYHSYNKPWNWIAPFDLNGIFEHPVYFQVSVTAGEKIFNSINWRGQGTLPIWYAFWLVVPMSVYMLGTKRETKTSLFILAWIVSTYFSWIVLELIKNCTGFNYYFIYTVPALCLGIAYFWRKLKVSEKIRKIGILIHLLSVLVFFSYYFPVGVFR